MFKGNFCILFLMMHLRNQIFFASLRLNTLIFNLRGSILVSIHKLTSFLSQVTFRLSYTQFSSKNEGRCPEIGYVPLNSLPDSVKSLLLISWFQQTDDITLLNASDRVEQISDRPSFFRKDCVIERFFLWKIANNFIFMEMFNLQTELCVIGFDLCLN